MSKVYSFDQDNVMSLADFSKSIKALVDRIGNLRPVYRRIANSFWQINRTRIFAGTNLEYFEDLADATIKDKRYRGFNVYPILSRTGQNRYSGSLRESLITGTNKHSVYKATETELELGTSNPKAEFHAVGIKTKDRGLIKRRAVDINRYPISRWAKWIGDYAMSGKT